MSLLSSVKVISLAGMLPGPYCCLLLADMGAEVIIVERPRVGDPVRQIPYWFESINRNKKSVTINLQSNKGRQIFYSLSKKSDVIIEGFLPGVSERLGVGYDAVRELNPSIIYASISGYGQHGPYRDWPGHELSYQGMAGILHSVASKGDFLPNPRLSIADISSGMFAAIATLAALYHKKETGKGDYIDISMVDGLVSWMSVALTRRFHTGEFAMELDPAYGIFQTQDGKYLTLSIAWEDHFWHNLCNAIGRKDISDLKRSERIQRKSELLSLLKEALHKKRRDEWMQLMMAQGGVPASPVLTLDEVIADSHLNEREMFIDMSTQSEKLKLVGSPFKFRQTPVEYRLPPPKLGEHTREVILDLGYSERDIEEFEKEGII
jgi:crotonobetainyl-CoA:carnitine CoA-transferase CaiB-like acyl-CoA transferase